MKTSIVKNLVKNIVLSFDVQLDQVYFELLTISFSIYLK